MTPQDQQFLQAMIHLGMMDQKYAQKILEEQRQLVEQGKSMRIPQLLLQLQLATADHIRRVEEFLGQRSSTVHQTSEGSAASSTANTIKSDSPVKASETKKHSDLAPAGNGILKVDH